MGRSKKIVMSCSSQFDRLMIQKKRPSYLNSRVSRVFSAQSKGYICHGYINKWQLFSKSFTNQNNLISFILFCFCFHIKFCGFKVNVAFCGFMRLNELWIIENYILGVVVRARNNDTREYIKNGNYFLIFTSIGNNLICLTITLQSCKLYNNKYMIGSTQITNNEIFAFIAVLVFTLLSRKVLFINRNNNRNC